MERYQQKNVLLINSYIDVFHKEYYTPSTAKTKFYLAHIKILGTNYCGKQRDGHELILSGLNRVSCFE